MQAGLDLDAPVRTYLPGFRLQDHGIAANVTPRHLLTHSGGWIGDWFPTPAAATMHSRAL
jgi:CubicO group peptidase (beta-lactamase class C family)